MGVIYKIKIDEKVALSTNDPIFTGVRDANDFLQVKLPT